VFNGETKAYMNGLKKEKTTDEEDVLDIRHYSLKISPTSSLSHQYYFRIYSQGSLEIGSRSMSHLLSLAYYCWALLER
jgi:hypothetical protein